MRRASEGPPRRAVTQGASGSQRPQPLVPAGVQRSLEAGEAFPGESPLDELESQIQTPNGARLVESAGAAGQVGARGN